MNDEKTLFDFHKNTNNPNNKDYWLGEELLVPFVNSCDSKRMTLFCAHGNQFVELKHAEPPKVFTGYENQIGEYSMAYKRALEDATIIARIRKNEQNEVLVVQYKDSGIYDVININPVVNICEDYGYALNNCVDSKEAGDTIHKDDYIYKSNGYDDAGNYGYGVNLKATYLTYKGKTYEDGIVLTESAAKKLTSYKVEKTMVSVNTNEILLNLYQGEDGKYKAIPRVGEGVYNDRVLVASRRTDRKSDMYNFKLDRVKTIQGNDTCYYSSGGKVVDIKIYCNEPLASLKKNKNGNLCKNESTLELIELYESELTFYKNVLEVLDTIIPPMTEKEYIASLKPDQRKAYTAEIKDYKHYYTRPVSSDVNENKYTDDLAYLWKYAHEYVDENIKWRYDSSSFKHFLIEFTVLKENKVSTGVKITGRYGNKGVVTSIIPDEEAPTCAETGRHTDIILNPLGVINRANPAQLKEQMINHIAYRVLDEMKEAYDNDDVVGALDIYLEYMGYVNKKQADYIDMKIIPMNRAEKDEFVKSVIENGIYVHIPPFYDNTSMDVFKEIYIKHPKWMEKYKCKDIEQAQVIGDEYFIRLKHETSNKMSIRSAGALNMKQMPAKSKLKKERKELFNDNAIRSGEMETTHLFIAKRPDLVSKLYRSYATSESTRSDLIIDLLKANDPFNINILDNDDKSTTRNILDKYLEVLELKLTE